MKRPNILLIYTDQQRWDALGASGNPEVQTPNLDVLASRGMLFEYAFANHPLCMPSRHSMLCGQYAEAIGSTFNGIEMREDIPCLQHVLSGYGYHTANIGKLHFRNHAHRNHRDGHPRYGFDTLILSDEPGCYDDAYIKWVEEHDPSAVDACRIDTHEFYCAGPRVSTGHGRFQWHPYTFEGPAELSHAAFVGDETCEFLRRRGSAPFFCVAGFYAPHTPLNPPQRFLDMYTTSSLSEPHTSGAEAPQRPELTPDDYRTIKAHYYALVSQVDAEVGRIMQVVDDEGLRENTVVIFTSDHGENLGDHGVFGKLMAEDSSSRVPLLVSYPGHVPAGRHCDAFIEAVDIVPTVLDWCGVQVPTAMQGRSFRGEAEGRQARAPRSDAYISLRTPFGPAYRALRSRDFLYVNSRAGHAARYCGPERLFDLSRDPHQLHNVIENHRYADALHHLRGRLLQRLFDAEPRSRRPTGMY